MSSSPSWWSPWQPQPVPRPSAPRPPSERLQRDGPLVTGNSAATVPPRRPSAPGQAPPQPIMQTQGGPRPLPGGQSPRPAGLAMRRDIEKMPRAEQERFVNALREMMRIQPTPLVEQLPRGGNLEEDLLLEAIRARPQRIRQWRSPFHRLASYHNDLCAHGREPFPGWHRAYLVEFEHELQEADRRLGGDGSIGLPYWDWVSSQRAPPIIREFFTVMPAELEGLVEGGYQIVSDSRLGASLRSGRMGPRVSNALAQMQQHWQFASTEQGGDTLESVHNSIHVYCGMPMASLAFAAYHPLFWLHHNNIDRLYEAYLRAHPESMDEWEDKAFQELQRSDRTGRLPRKQDKDLRRRNRQLSTFERPLAPFMHRKAGRFTVQWSGNGRSGVHATEWAANSPFMPEDCLSSVSLGYDFDELPFVPDPATAGEQMREVPTLALWKNLDVTGALAHKSYVVHVYVLPQAQAQAWVAPTDREQVDDLPGYAGNVGIFGGRTEEECDTCRTRSPISIYVDISGQLREQGLSRFSAALRVVVEDGTGQLLPLSATPLGEPIIDGPYFEAPDLMLQQGVEAYDAALAGEQVVGEVKALQEYMKRYGYYDANVDGSFGPKTEAAVKRLQKVLGVEVDGVAGPETRAAMLRKRVDPLMDEGDGAVDAPTFKPGQTVRWWMGVAPGYLVDEDVRFEIYQVFDQWAQAVPLRFEEVLHAADAQIKFEFGSKTADGSFTFDGAGGALAYCREGTITMDISEVWLRQGDPSRPNAFHLLPVLLHEVGHALGLRHSEVVDEVMSPFYDEAKVTLRQGDKLRIALLYPVEDTFTQAFNALDLNQDGVLSKEEFMQGVTTRGSAPLSQAEADQMWAKADPQGTGSCDLASFIALMTAMFQG